MSNGLPISDLERGTYAKFETVGTRYVGEVVSVTQAPQTDYETGAVLTWNDGSTRLQLVIELDVDGDRRTLYARGGKYDVASGKGKSMEAAIVAAVKAAGCDSIDVGARLAVEHSGLSVAKRGMNAAKLYVAQYEPPRQSVPVAGLFSDDEGAGR